VEEKEVKKDDKKAKVSRKANEPENKKKNEIQPGPEADKQA